MDGTSFDTLARGIGRATDRRAALKGLAAGLFAVGTARAVAATASAQDEVADPDGPSTEACGIKNEGCFRNHDCCQGLKCRGTNGGRKAGSCDFKNSSGGKGDWCNKDKDCKRNLECDRRRNKSKNKCVKP